MDKHLMIFIPVVLWPVHFETDLEIIQRHLDDGWNVTVLQCRSELRACAQNFYHRWTDCQRCKSRFMAGINWLGKQNVILNDMYFLNNDECKTVQEFESLTLSSASELRSIKIDGADIGLAALGSLISLLREPEFDVVSHRHLVVSALQTATITFYSVRNHLKIQNPDKLVLFNGRFAELRAALLAALSVNVPVFVHERSGVLEKYSITANGSPHDLTIIKKMIDDVFSNSTLDYTEKTRIAAEWYAERRDNKPQSWYSFIDSQQKGVLPELSSDRSNVVIFNSSEDEMEAFDYWKNPIYRNQTDGINRIAEIISNDSRFKLFLRIHPNLKGVDNSQVKSINSLKERFPSLTVIPAESPVSTYDLMDACDVVVSFGTTVGIEAAYAGKPVFLLGRAIYEDLNCCIKPKSHDEFIFFIDQLVSGNRKMIPDTDRLIEGTIKYGLFNKLWGEEYSYVKPCNVAESKMIKNGKMVDLKCSVASTLAYRIANLFYKK